MAKTNILIFVGIFCTLLPSQNSLAATAAQSLGSPSCAEVLNIATTEVNLETEHEAKDEKNSKPWIQAASQATGILIGAANGILITASGGNLHLLAPQLAMWLPLFNEMANVATTVAGREYIYSGVRKKIIDGIAMGGIVGQSFDAATNMGPYAALVTFGASALITYWFPNKYFHKIMKGVPNLKMLSPKMKMFFEKPAGEGVVGVNMIVILELLLKVNHYLVHFLPSHWSYQPHELLTFPDIIIRRIAIVPRITNEALV